MKTRKYSVPFSATSCVYLFFLSFFFFFVCVSVMKEGCLWHSEDTNRFEVHLGFTVISLLSIKTGIVDTTVYVHVF